MKKRKRRNSRQKKIASAIFLVFIFLGMAGIIYAYLDDVPTMDNIGSVSENSGNIDGEEKQDSQDTKIADKSTENSTDQESTENSDNNPTAQEKANTAVTGGSEPQLESEYSIEVIVKDQKVLVYKQGNLIKEFIASTGINNSTPTGDFTIQNRGEWFFSEKYQQGAKYWVSFKDWGVYLFHSLPMDRQQNIIPEEAAKLGSPASHGCVRLQLEDAKWIYDNIPQGTKVHIE
ncbi:MAG: L,D-transpeptidase family protein [Peptococcaceae bacterium]|nr:L,D-transpeptidase family protein [Peptococcaceae bacterium]